MPGDSQLRPFERGAITGSNPPVHSKAQNRSMVEWAFVQAPETS